MVKVMVVPHTVEVSPATWVLPNRVEFPVWMAETFRYAAASTDPRGLYVHQRFVRDFLQPASPYRGLLLYHGLGVGKTCASIAIADVLRPPSQDPTGKVFVLLPAFLRGNFVEEVRKCGDPRFIPEQKWVKGEDGAFRRDVDGGIQFTSLPPVDRDAIKAQIDKDIVEAYTVIHYNGLSTKSVHALCDGSVNRFDDSVVIIDEAPNVISQVMHGKLLAHLYQRIMDADRCKVVLLSGTPLMNTPLELAYICNLTHGYIRELSFSDIPSGVDVLTVEQALGAHTSVDHATSEILVGGSKITLTLLPSGFVRSSSASSTSSTVQADINAPRPSALIEELQQLATATSGTVLKAPSIQNRWLLPIDSAKFMSSFVTADVPNPDVHNPEVLARRMLGSLSVYSSTDPALMPTILPAKVVRVPMSDRQYEEYLVQRDIERRKERAAARYAAKAGAADSDESKNLYRAFSRSLCTFVFPEGIKRIYRADIYKTLDDDVENEDDGQAGEEMATTARATAKKKVERAYDRALEESLALINADRTRLLAVSGDLKTLSPKYFSILSHLLEPKTRSFPAIIYSQFRRVEGLGLLRMSLIANGFAELIIVKRQGTLVAELYPADASPKTPRFIVYGNDDVDAAAAMLKVFNSQLDALPSTLLTSITKLLGATVSDPDGNRHGAIARLLLITQSGSEGISTQNVREVHIIEPFWHANRILQVVGRAARTNSHSDLPKEERTIEVFVYAATFTPSQADDVTIKKLDKQRTSDEHILNVATQKRILLDKFTDVMRRSAVDCVLHHPRAAATRCFAHNLTTLNKGAGALAFHTDIDVDIATQGRRVRLVPFVLPDGRQGLADPVTGDVYDKAIHAAMGRFKRIGQKRPSSIARHMHPTAT